MNLSYAKLRKVLSIFIKNKTLRIVLNDLVSGKEKEINELGFLDLLEESEADIEVLEILTEKQADQISPEEAFETFSIFFLLYESHLEEVKTTARRFGIKRSGRDSENLERLEMALRGIGFNQMDFAEMTLPELYLRYCIQIENIRKING